MTSARLLASSSGLPTSHSRASIGHAADRPQTPRRDQRRGFNRPAILRLDMALSRAFSRPLSLRPDPCFQAEKELGGHGKGHALVTPFVTAKPLIANEGHAVTQVTPSRAHMGTLGRRVGGRLSYARARERDPVTFISLHRFCGEISIGWEGHAFGHAGVTLAPSSVTFGRGFGATHCLLGGYSHG
jgi:hypothetical protein